MESIIVVLACLVGVLGGIVGLDFRQRTRVKSELTDMLTKINEVHNTLVKQVAEMQDRVNTHEFKLSGVKK